MMPRSIPGVPNWGHDGAGRQTAERSRPGEQPADESAGRSPTRHRGTQGGRSGKSVRLQKPWTIHSGTQHGQDQGSS